MSGMKKAEAKKMAAELVIAWLTNDVANEGRLSESPEYMELTDSGKRKVEAAINDFKAVIAKKAKLTA